MKRTQEIVTFILAKKFVPIKVWCRGEPKYYYKCNSQGANFQERTMFANIDLANPLMKEVVQRQIRVGPCLRVRFIVNEPCTIEWSL